MTICVAWVRTAGQCQELVLASDSRLSGGEIWDGCPKVMILPRNDTIVAFAGSTLRAYPLMLQLVSSIASFPASRRHVMDFDEMKGHAVRVFNFMLGKAVHKTSTEKEQFQEELLRSSFLLCGYSWRMKRLRIIKICYDQKLKAYVSHSFKVRKRTCVFIGDVDLRRSIDIPGDADGRLKELLKSRGKLPSGVLDWEPFEVLRDVILEEKYPSVGGPPQLAKVYQHMNTQIFGIYWPSRRAGRLTIGGRDTMDYERTDWPRLDAATLEVSSIALEDSTALF